MYTQPEKTNEELDKEQANLIISMANQTAYGIERLHEDGFRAFWNYPRKQEVLDILGEQGFQIFEDSAYIQTLLAKRIPDYNVLMPLQPHRVENGRVILEDVTE
jgi:hypothetical protein